MRLLTALVLAWLVDSQGPAAVCDAELDLTNVRSTGVTAAGEHTVSLSGGSPGKAAAAAVIARVHRIEGDTLRYPAGLVYEVALTNVSTSPIAIPWRPGVTASDGGQANLLALGLE